MKVTGNRREYVNTLLQLETLAGVVPIAAISVHGGSLVNRIRRIAASQTSRKKSMLPGTGMALLSTLALAVLTTLSALAMTSGR
jgi:beta-lactamase regulating signal transducer with metallopeptidase domain